MECGALPNEISKKMAEILCVKPEEVARKISAATGYKPAVVGMITKVPVSFRNIFVDLYFLLVDVSPLAINIGDPEMEAQQGIFDIRKMTVQLTRKGNTVEISLEPD